MYKMVGDICKPNYQEESILSKTLRGFYSFSVKMKIKSHLRSKNFSKPFNPLAYLDKD